MKKCTVCHDKGFIVRFHGTGYDHPPMETKVPCPGCTKLPAPAFTQPPPKGRPS